MRIPKSRIPKQIPGYKYGHFPSWKMQRSLVHQTGLEADMLEWLDYRADISVIVSHPDIDIPYMFEGKWYRYEPDLFCIGDKYWFVGECKARKYITTPKNQTKIQSAITWCQKRDGHFHLFTDDLYKDNLVVSLRLLRRYSRYKVDEQLTKLIHRVFYESHSDGLPIWQIAESANSDDPRSIVPYIYTMLYHHHLSTDLRSEKVNINSIIYIN